ASKNRRSSSSSFPFNKSGSKSPFSNRCRHHAAAASDASNKTSPFSQLPESTTTDCIAVSCNAHFEATNTGAELKLSERESGKLFKSASPRQCNRHVSPSAIAFHDGVPDLRSSSTP